MSHCSEATLHSAARDLVAQSASERLVRASRPWAVELCTSRAGSCLGNVDGKPSSAAHHQRRMEWPPAVARVFDFDFKSDP